MPHQVISVSLPKEVVYVLNKQENKSETVSKALMFYFGELTKQKIINSEVGESVKDFRRQVKLPARKFSTSKIIKAKNHGRL